MTTMLGTDLDSATHKLCVSDEKQESHPKLTEKSPPESHPPVWDTFYQVDFSYTLNGFVIFWCPISSQQHSAACQADLKWSCTWKCNLLGYLSPQRHFFTLNLVFQGQNWCFFAQITGEKSMFSSLNCRISSHCLAELFPPIFLSIFDGLVCVKEYFSQSPSSYLFHVVTLKVSC